MARQARRMVIGLFQSEENEINVTSKQSINFKGIDILTHEQHVFSIKNDQRNQCIS